MAEVLAKAKKYINGEEALLSKWGSCSMQKEKNKDEKKWGRSPRGQRDRDKRWPSQIRRDLAKRDTTKY